MGLLVFLVVMLALLLVCVLVILALVFRIFLVLGFLLLCLSAIVLYPGSIVWAYLDAKARGKPGWALALLVALSPFLALIGWPLCLLAWIVFRPEKKSGFSNLGAGAYGSTPAHP